MSWYQNNQFPLCDLYLMTLALELDLHTKIKFPCQLLQTDTQTKRKHYLTRVQRNNKHSIGGLYLNV